MGVKHGFFPPPLNPLPPGEGMSVNIQAQKNFRIRHPITRLQHSSIFIYTVVIGMGLVRTSTCPLLVLTGYVYKPLGGGPAATEPSS